MSTYSCDPSPLTDQKEAPKETSSTFVVGRWTFHAYRMSHDGKTTVIHHEDGVELLSGSQRVRYKMDLKAHNPREFIFSPDSRYVAFWAPLEPGNLQKRVAVMDVGSLPSKPEFRIVYQPEVGVMPFGLEWSPKQDALYVIERARKDKLNYTQIRRVPMPAGGKGTVIVERQGVIDFFMPPVSRFENAGGKPSAEPYKIIFGAQDGLYLVGPKGEDEEPVAKLPATGLHNIEWNPKPTVNQVLLFFRFPSPGPDGSHFKGVYLVDLDKRKSVQDPLKNKQQFIEQLYDDVDIHTLWFSPKGTYATWASKAAVYLRRPEETTDKRIRLQVLDPDGEPLPVKGVSWSDDEKLLAFTAGPEVHLYDVASKKQWIIARFQKGFVAEPRWQGGRVFLTQVSDAGAELKKIRNKFDDGGGPPTTVKPGFNPSKADIDRVGGKK